MDYKEYVVKVYVDGAKIWYVNDKLHREDGPAVERANGTKHWYINGKLHREDGPAIEYVDGDRYWFINGQRLTEEQFNDIHIKTIVIDGKTYKLVLQED